MVEAVPATYEKVVVRIKLEDFETCAKELQHLSQVQQSLGDHLNSEELSRYKSAQNVLINSLVEASSKFDEILTRDTVTEDDFSEISKVVKMLASAKNSSCLQPHLSVEIVSKSHNDLIKKIEAFTLSQISKIEKKLREDKYSFDGLEVHLSQVMLFRKIPIIEFKTGESYHSLLTTIFNSVKDIRLDIEHTLMSIFDKGEAKYKELNNNLLRLKSAKWVEKYRDGLYTDVFDNVQNQIIQHLNNLKKHVQEANLDYSDNYALLIPTFKKVDELCNLLSLDVSIPKMKEIIDEIGQEFIKSTESVFIQIIHEYNSDVLKSGIQNYYFDASKIEKLIHYIENATKIGILARGSSRGKADEFLQSFLNNYSKLLQGEYIRRHEFLVNLEGQSFSKEETSRNVYVLSKMFQEINEIYTNHKETLYDQYFSRGTNVLASWKRRLQELVGDVRIKLNQALSMKSADVTALLATVKVLTKLDEYIDGDDEKFSGIFREFSERHLDETEHSHIRLLNHLFQHDYRAAASDMEELNLKTDNLSKTYLRKAKHAFNSSLTDLLERIDDKIVALSPQLTTEELENLKKELKKMEKAHLKMKKFLINPGEIEKLEKKVKNTLSLRVSSYIEGLNTSLLRLKFVEAESKLIHLTHAFGWLQNYISEDVQNKIRTLAEEFQQKVEKIIREYTSLGLEDYEIKNPLSVLEKFHEAREMNSIYVTGQEKIKAAMRDNFTTALANVKQNLSYMETNPYRKFEQSLKYLPTDLKESFRSDIESAKADFILKQKSHNRQFQEALASPTKNLESLRQIYEEEEEKAMEKEKEKEDVEPQNEASATEIKAIIKVEVTKCVESLNGQLQEFKIEEAFESMKKILDYHSIFGKLIIGIDVTQQEMKKIFLRFIDHLFLAVYLPPKLANASINFVRRVENRYDVILEILRLGRLSKYQELYKYVSSIDFAEKYVLLNKMMIAAFSSLKTEIMEGLEKMNIQMIQSSMTALEKWGSFSEKVKSNLQRDLQYADSELLKAMPDKKKYMKFQLKIAEKFTGLKTEILNANFVLDKLNFCEQSVDENYKKISQISALLKSVLDQNFSGTGLQREDLKACQDAIEQKIMEISRKAKILLRKILDETSHIETQEFVVHFYHLNSISKNLETSLPISYYSEALENMIWEKVKSYQTLCEKNFQNPEQFGRAMRSIKSISHHTTILKDKINSKMEELLIEYRLISTRDKDLAKLRSVLNADQNGIGQTIISDHKCFEDYPNAIFFGKTNKHGINYVISEINGNVINKAGLKERYFIFEEEYKRLVAENLKPHNDLTPLIKSTIMVHNRTPKCGKVWDSNLISNIPNLMARVFAIWTLTNATNYFEATDSVEKARNYLLQPHAAQVIAIFRMLGIGDSKEVLSSNLVQMGTGEGKSIVMAVTACVLALSGFEVSCACYSEYLCNRDFNGFRGLFHDLDLLDKIHYGTFSKLCEDMINRDGDIRKTIGDLISTNNWSTVQGISDRLPRILIIDEVDVFFQKDFYGNTYTPSVSLRDPTIRDLTDYIWNNRDSKLRLVNVKKTEQYLKCCSRFAGWEDLIEEAVKDMLADVQTFEAHDYVPKADKIAYKDQTNFVYNVAYGYKTLFAYYKEHAAKNISSKSLQENVKIVIKCGSFSYAEIPKQFDFIMGVTGTLKTLSQKERNIIENVIGIKKKTYVPSVFGKNNLKSKIDIYIENEADYNHRIAQNILKAVESHRAVLVFFENDKKLREFYNKSTALLYLKAKYEIQYLTEEASSQEKESFIKRATVAKKINLLTRSFGRGTDFVCYDQTVKKNGGIHVIQTFLSEELSEETQIKGRTARQGNEGSYDMVLLDKSLEKFGITLENIESFYKQGAFIKFKNWIYQTRNSSPYEVLDEARQNFGESQFKRNNEYETISKKKHEASSVFLKDLFSQNQNAVREFLKGQNKGVEEEDRLRTLVLMDATDSMSSSLLKVKNIVGSMFERATTIARKKGLPIECFEMQFAVYRNYDHDAKSLLECSSWETKPELLRTFMNQIECSGGLRNEAIEIGLWHANQEASNGLLNHVILIGDTPANTKENIQSNRSCFGEDYWSKTKFKNPIYFKDELQKLKQRGISIHAFYVDKGAQKNFEEIVKETNGRCQFLDIHSNEQEAAMMIDLVIEEILKTVGKTKGVSNRFADEYSGKSGKSYL